MIIVWVSLMLAVGALVVPVSVSAQAFTSWAPGPGAALDNTYDGFIDVPAMNGTVPSAFTVAGWFVDKSAEGWAGADNVQVWLGTMDGGGKMLAQAVFGQDRPDVAAATGNPFWAGSGFSAAVPPGSLPTGTQLVSVYAHTPGKGWWFKQTQVSVSSAAAAAPGAVAPAPVVSGGAFPIVAITKPKEGEQVPTKNEYEIIGYALDRNASPNQGVAGSGINRVEVYLGKEREEGGTFLGEAELGFSDADAQSLYGSQFASAGWRLRFKPTQFKANTYSVFAYARSVVTGKEDVVGRFFTIREG
jgi:hypothetical protein